MHVTDKNSDPRFRASLLSEFDPPKPLRNPHFQTIFSSVGPRRLKVSKKFAPYKGQEQSLLLNCGEGVRLAGVLNVSGKHKSEKLVILIHGWEGSQNSSYMLSMASEFLDNGIDVFRLNLRDHGDTHHLNEGIFNSTLIDEVIGGIADLQSRLNYQNNYLVGFSLGGNFCLRVAAQGRNKGIVLNCVVAFCPAVHASTSNQVLNAASNWFYGRYFVRKWKRSLRKKLDHYPNYTYGSELDKMKTLDEMNKRLIPEYTVYSDVEEYFDAYAIDGDRLADTICPCYLHFSKDDMIIPVEGAYTLEKNENLHVTITEYGGHCGFIRNWKLDSWQDQRALEIVSNS